jgi:tetratricopeptide (TPR) repeat protein
MNKRRSIILIAVVFLCFPIKTFAETIILKSGKSVEGKLIEKTDKYIKIDFLGVPLTYFFDEVESIDGKPVYASGKSVTIEILNPEYAKLPDMKNNIEINSESTVEEIFKKVTYYYSTHDFDKAIELCKLALQKTDDRNLIAEINFSLSSNYLEKGIEAYNRNKDDSFYKLSIQSAKKCLEVMPDSWQALANIGSVYTNMRDWKQALFYISEAEKYLNKNDPNYAALEIHRNLVEEMSKKIN